jgi:hypothetical protein
MDFYYDVQQVDESLNWHDLAVDVYAIGDEIPLGIYLNHVIEFQRKVGSQYGLYGQDYIQHYSPTNLTDVAEYEMALAQTHRWRAKIYSGNIKTYGLDGHYYKVQWFGANSGWKSPSDTDGSMGVWYTVTQLD